MTSRDYAVILVMSLLQSHCIQKLGSKSSILVDPSSSH